MRITLIFKRKIIYLFNTAVEIGNSGTRVRARPQDRMSPLRLPTLFYYFFYFNFTSLFLTLIKKKKPIVSQNKRGLKVVAGNANKFFQNFNITVHERLILW